MLYFGKNYRLRWSDFYTLMMERSTISTKTKDITWMLEGYHRNLPKALSFYSHNYSHPEEYYQKKIKEADSPEAKTNWRRALQIRNDIAMPLLALLKDLPAAEKQLGPQPTRDKEITIKQKRRNLLAANKEKGRNK